MIPNVAASYKVSRDATTYTMQLRKGLKWSDVEPVTADDIMRVARKHFTTAKRITLISTKTPGELKAGGES